MWRPFDGLRDLTIRLTKVPELVEGLVFFEKFYLNCILFKIKRIFATLKQKK